MYRKVLGWTCLWFLATAVLSSAAQAEYEAGQAAWKAGRPAEALAQWLAAAKTEDARAMLALGRAYVKGLGVPQDYVEAHKWLNLAAARGNVEAVAERDALAAKMTTEEQAEARRLVRSWRSGEKVDAPKTAAIPRAAPPSLSADQPPPRAIREAQALMTALGYKPGPADGRWGPRTGRAYTTFLRDAGLPPGKVLTPEALRAMRAAAKGRNVTAAVSSPRPAPVTQRKAAPRPADLHRLVAAGDVDGLRAALAAGADPNARDGKGWTALMHAADRGYTLLVPPLLDAKAAVNIRAPDGATALFMAGVHGHTQLIVMLMRAGASVSIQGPQGKTAVDAAQMRYGEPEVARKKGVDAAVLALLDGRTWAEVEDEAKRLAAKWPAGKKLRDCEVCPELVVIPAGRFRMGSQESERPRSIDESPVHKVTIAEPFAVGVYEVTVEEFGHFVQNSGHSPGETCFVYGGGYRIRKDRSWRNPGFRQNGREPVVCVSWMDAQLYVRWLSSRTGEQYRLLSESEWEYVARAGTRTPFHYGRSISTQHANYNWRFVYGVGLTGARKGHEKPISAGSFPPNAFGLHDTHGNVREWVEDCWHPSYNGAPSDGSAWTGSDCRFGMARGGSWRDAAENLRSAYRGGSQLNNYLEKNSELVNGFGIRVDSIGIRVARTLIP